MSATGELCARALLVALLALVGGCERAARNPHRLVVWHGYRGDEERALRALAQQAQRSMPGISIELLSVPYDAYASKLESAIPHGHGPDVFIDAHERLASYQSRGLIAPLGDALAPPESGTTYEPIAAAALTRNGVLYGVPLSIKCIALYVNTQRVTHPPRTMEEIEALRGVLPAGTYPLAYYAANAYFHAPFAHAFGSGLVDDATGRYLFDGEPAQRSIEYVMELTRRGVIPDEADGSLVTQMFVNGSAATAMSGPWFEADLPAAVRARTVVVPLPTLRGRVMAPFATVEGAYVSSHATDPGLARRFARFLATPAAAVVRATVGHQVVATVEAWRNPAVAADASLTTFHDAARAAIPMPTHPNMRASFEPANAAIRRAMRGDVSVRDALAQSAHRFADATRPPPSRRNPIFTELLVGAVAMAFAFAALRRARDPQFRVDLARSWPAYRYVLHAAVVLLLLVIAPLVIGAATSLFAGHEGAYFYVGAANYVDILTARGGALLATGSFYLVLVVTIAWTLANITLHVAIGVVLALLLSHPRVKLKALFRVVLILPWAVPSYVTALAWKGMFHRQLGAVNAVIAALGGHPVAWFARFATSFAANVATNVWLGFPFMMVVTLGALAGIPRDLYEAASVDGATAWQRFWRITVPMLRPSMAPAVAMGAVWTFNMFNVIFLVSGGEPDGQTDILVTEAYRWAFTRQAQYGYAAAYAVLIFAILFLATRTLDRLVARAERVKVTR